MDVICGDADHDQHPELYLDAPGETLYALEHVSRNQFAPICLNWVTGCHWDIGDPDHDGRTDFIGQRIYDIMLLESRDSSSLPDTVVATLNTRSFGACATITNLDQDYAPEITCVAEGDTRAVNIYENVGPNLYVLKNRLQPNGQVCTPSGIAQTFDMDRDGWPELVTGSWEGWVVFYEATGNDTFACRQVNELQENTIDGIAAANDMDRDGRPEAIALGVEFDNIAHLWVFESPCSDSFEVVWSAAFDGSYFFEPQIAVGDLDGDCSAVPAMTSMSSSGRRPATASQSASTT